MGKIVLSGPDIHSVTMVSNRFIDDYMANANGEFVKIYLYLLRSLAVTDFDISVCHIADIFNHTEKDVIRSLKYWEQVGLLQLNFDDSNTLTNIYMNEINPKNSNNHTETTVLDKEVFQTLNKKNTVLIKSNSNTDTSTKKPVTNTVIAKSTQTTNLKRTYTANEMDKFKEKSDVVEFLYLAQKYIGKPLSGSDTNTLLYMYDVLCFEAELIEYLIEYCVSNGHKSLRYMEKVAISWAEEDINTVDKAKASTSLYNKNCYPVLKAFGLNGRNPGESEKSLIIKWTNTYGFSMDIILDACNRTMKQIHQPSFEYADTILTKWKKHGIKTINDIKSLDDEHQKNKTAQSNKTSYTNSTGTESLAADSKNKPSKNSFNNFTQRNYNYETLEKELLGNI